MMVPDPELARSLHQALLASLDLRRRDIVQMPEAELRALAGERLAAIIAPMQLPQGTDRCALVQFVVDEAIGLVIHENRDDHASQPIGGAGGRFFCGVIGAR